MVCWKVVQDPSLLLKLEELYYTEPKKAKNLPTILQHISPLALAQLSNAVYSMSEGDVSTDGSLCWKYIKSYRVTGLVRNHKFHYQEKTHKYNVLSIRGTENEGDLLNDIMLAAGGPLHRAMADYCLGKKLLASIGDLKPENITGHSLGGYLTHCVCRASSEDRFGVVFNTFSNIPIGTPGVVTFRHIGDFASFGDLAMEKGERLVCEKKPTNKYYLTHQHSVHGHRMDTVEKALKRSENFWADRDVRRHGGEEVVVSEPERKQTEEAEKAFAIVSKKLRE